MSSSAFSVLFAGPGIQALVIDRFRLIILGPDPQHIGFDAQVQVFGHQDRAAFLAAVEMVRHGQDAIVELLGIQGGRKAAPILMV